LLVHSRLAHQTGTNSQGEAGRASSRRERRSITWAPPLAPTYGQDASDISDHTDRSGSRPAAVGPPTAPERAPAPEATTLDSDELLPGSRVIHRLFGEGTVLKVTKERGGTSVEVLFKSAGKKTLDPNFAKLEKL
ncbi:MAG: hypothetical protein ACLQUY_12945, partial [Ktedonobacterales bacterium]